MSKVAAEMAIVEIANELKINNLLKMYELGIIDFKTLKKGMKDIYKFTIPDIEKGGLDATD